MVEQVVLEPSLVDTGLGEGAHQFLEHPHHLVVGLPGEQQLPRVELVDATRDAPHVQGGAVYVPHDDLGGSVEP